MTVAELRAQLRSIRDLWLAERKRHGHEAFTDPAALRAFRTVLPRAQREGEWTDIEAAVREHAAEAKASPWNLAEWTREAMWARADREHNARKLAERAEGEIPDAVRLAVAARARDYAEAMRHAPAQWSRRCDRCKHVALYGHTLCSDHLAPVAVP